MKQSLNNNALYITASVFDSVTPATHIVCNNYLQGDVIRHPRPQTNLNSPESRSLDPPGVLELGGCFF